MVFHVISLIWNVAFAINFLDFLASGMMGYYYFDEDPEPGECFWYFFFFRYNELFSKGTH